MRVLYSFGLNEDGQCGTSTKKDQKGIYYPSPARFPNKIEIVDVCAGSRHTLALSSCGNVFSWGYGQQGQLGHGSTESFKNPEIVFALKGKQMTMVSAGGMHSGCIDSENNCYTWGSNSYGQLGLGKQAAEINSLPSLVVGVDDDVYPTKTFPFKVTKLSCGGLHTAAVDMHGDVYCWGKADSGQTGYAKWYLDFSIGISAPKKVEGYEGTITQVSCGGFHTLLLTDKGQAYAMGKEDFGMLGTKVSKDSMAIGAEVPTLVAALQEFNIVSIRAGGWHSSFLTDDGQLFTCGKGEYGRLGVGSEKSMVEPTLVNCHVSTSLLVGMDAPLMSPGGSARCKKVWSEDEDVNYVRNTYNIDKMSAGGSHTIWATDKGQVYTVGRVASGRLGLCQHNAFSKQDRTILPNNITSNFYKLEHANVIRVSAGGSHTTVLVDYPNITEPEAKQAFLEEIERNCGSHSSR